MPSNTLTAEEADDFAWTPNTLRWNATGTAYTRLATLEEGQQTPFPDRQSTAVGSKHGGECRGGLANGGNARLHQRIGA